MNQLRLNDQRAKAAIALIWLVLALDALLLIFTVFQYFLIQEIVNGMAVSDTLAIIANYGAGSSSSIYMLAFIISGITFIRWFRRAYYNLATITHNTEYGDGWAAGGWFVPIMNLFVPYKIMKELYIKTDKYLMFKQDYGDKKKLKTDYVGWWWALWIITGIAGNIILRIEFRGLDLDPDTTFFMNVLNSALSIVLAIVTIIVVTDYSEAEKILYQVVQEGDEEEETINYIL